MKGASKVFYIIGMVTNSILILVMLIGMILFSICLADQSIIWEMVKAEPDPEATFVIMLGVFTALLIVSVVMIVVESVVLVFVIRALKSLNNKEKPTAPHVLILVLSILGVNIPLLLGSIFGLVSQSTFDDDDEDEE